MLAEKREVRRFAAMWFSSPAQPRRFFRPTRAAGWLTLALLLPSCASIADVATSAPTVWSLDNLKQIGGQAPLIEGAPKVVREKSGAASIVFDGKADALVSPVNPIEGWSQFTIEILFSPATDGQMEQRFFHVQDNAG